MVKIGPLELKVESYTAEELAHRHKTMPEPGRCADRIEDFFMVLAGGWNNTWDQHSTAFSTMLECLRSEKGDEPRERYVQLPQDSPFWQDHGARPSKVARLRAQEQQQQQQQLLAQDQRQQQQVAQAQRQGQQQQQPAGAKQQDQQQQQTPQQGYSWLWWWRRRSQPLAAESTPAAE